MSAASSATDVVLPRNFDITRLSYGQPKQQATGAKTIFIGYAGKQFYLQTPEMKAPFGVSVWPSDNGGPDKHSLDMSFEGRELREPLEQFFQAMQAIDKRLVQDAMDNSQAWFKKKYPSVDVVEALYSPTIKYSKDRNTGEINTQYAPTFKMSLPLKDGKFQFPAYGSRREELDLHEVIASGRSKGARVQAIVQLSAVWIVGNKFGLMWKVRQLKISEPVRLAGYAFQATEEDAPEDELDAADASDAAVRPRIAAAPAAPAARKATPNMMPESDEEDGGERSAVDEDGIEP
jgi:hypothetical protein